MTAQLDNGALLRAIIEAAKEDCDEGIGRHHRTNTAAALCHRLIAHWPDTPRIHTGFYVRRIYGAAHWLTSMAQKDDGETPP